MKKLLLSRSFVLATCTATAQSIGDEGQKPKKEEHLRNAHL